MVLFSIAAAAATTTTETREDNNYSEWRAVGVGIVVAAALLSLSLLYHFYMCQNFYPINFSVVIY